MTEKIKNVHFKPWSQPFRFIFLPWILVFLVIFFWFSFVPLLFAYYIRSSHPTSTSKCIFLAVLLLIFIIILCILIYFWKKLPKKRKNDFCTVTKLEKDLEACVYCLDTPEVAEKRPMLTLDLRNPISEDTEEVCIRSRPHNDEDRPLSQNLEVALTPRELFFRQLYESVHETDSSITRDFIQRERQYSSKDLESNIDSVSSSVSWELRLKASINGRRNKSSVSDHHHLDRNYSDGSDGETKMDKTGNVSEFFVANVTQKKSVTSEAFLYVSGESEKPNKVVRNIVSVHSEEDDDVFQK